MKIGEVPSISPHQKKIQTYELQVYKVILKIASSDNLVG